MRIRWGNRVKCYEHKADLLDRNVSMQPAAETLPQPEPETSESAVNLRAPFGIEYHVDADKGPILHYPRTQTSMIQCFPYQAIGVEKTEHPLIPT